MSKKRIIACILVRDGIVVQSLGFNRYLPVGRPEIAARFFDQWGVDEIILLDMLASRRQHLVDIELVSRVAAACFVPLAVGGGIRSTDDVRTLVHSGADKVVVNRIAAANPSVVRDSVRLLGRQGVIGSVDVRKVPDADAWHVFIDGGAERVSTDAVEYIRQLADLGIGEVVVNSIDRDGSGTGYDLELISRVSRCVDIPVIGLGGAGHPQHFADLFDRTAASAAAAANIFHFTEHSIALVKGWLARGKHDVRQDWVADYSVSAFDAKGRLARFSDDYLDNLIFEYIPKEVI